MIEQEEIIEKSIKGLPIIRGVYFLINKTEQIVYIGKSKHCYARIKTHKSCNKKYFNKHFILQVDKDTDLETLETKYIKKFKPFFNKSAN